MEEIIQKKIRSFTDLNAWEEGHQLVLMVYKATDGFPPKELFALTNQMRRCVISITSNIAEGFSRETANDKYHLYIIIAQGSLTELQNQLLAARDIGYLSEESFREIADQSVRVHKLLNGLKRIKKDTKYQIPNTRYGMHAFTLLELLIVIGMLGAVLALGAPTLLFFQRASALGDSAEDLVNTLRQAQGRAVASEGASQWGVKFATSASPQRFTLFKGSSYAGRVPSQDKAHTLPSAVELFRVTLLGGGDEVVFSRVVGTTSQAGTLALRLKANPARVATTSIEASGRILAGEASVSALPEPTPRDSRHAHVNYSRAIATATENITLAFEGGLTQTLSIAGNLKDNQLDWTGSVTVAGEPQTLTIRSHRLNAPDTQFSVSRDRSRNTRSVTLRLSADTSGTFLEYSADGLITTRTSIYASSPEWR